MKRWILCFVLIGQLVAFTVYNAQAQDEAEEALTAETTSNSSGEITAPATIKTSDKSKSDKEMKVTVVPGVSESELENRKQEFITRMKDRNKEMGERLHSLQESVRQSSPKVRSLMNEDVRGLRTLYKRLENNLNKASNTKLKNWETTRQQIIDDQVALNQNLKTAQKKFNRAR